MKWLKRILPWWESTSEYFSDRGKGPLDSTSPGLLARVRAAQIRGIGLEAGTLVGSRFQILAFLGQGGMGAVYLAYDRVHKTRKALKFLRPHRRNRRLQIRFHREAKISSRLDHPHIVKVYGMHQWQGLDFMEMEYLAGHTLEDRIEREGSIPPREVAEIALALSRALALAHKENIIHRDIKPENVFFTPSETYKIGDFGIAKDNLATVMTKPGSIVGTIQYLSPEQLEGEKLDGRADVYALGATLFHALTGHPPFEGTTGEICRQILSRRATLSSEIQSQLPSPFVHLIYQMLSKDRADRPSSMVEVASRSREILVQWEDSWGREEPPEGEGKKAVVLLAFIASFLGVILLLGLIVFFLF